MHSRSALLILYVTACTVLAMPRLAGAAGELSVTVSSATGAAVEGAVIIAEPHKGGARPHAGQKAVTAVDFPNSDQVRHQVYSFSGAKKFELALYAGRPQAPVIFERAGLVTLGCNIHDNMLGYIWVTDSLWYGQSDASGRLQLHDLAAGAYTVRIWHALLNESGPQLEQRINVADNQVTAANFSLKRPLRARMHNHGADKKWEDY
jgi:plastocyanin